MDKGTSQDKVRAPVVTAAIVSGCLALSLTACGSGAVTPPDNGNRPPNGASSGDGRTGEYRFNLPPSNTGVEPVNGGSEGTVYLVLQESCSRAAQRVTQGYESFKSPRNAVLYMAGVHVCRGDYDQARVYYDHARAEYGLDGLGPEGRAECELYKSVASVLEQGPRENFPCPGGTDPQWRYSGSKRSNPFNFDVDKRPENNVTGDGDSGGNSRSADEEEKYDWNLPPSDGSTQSGSVYVYLERDDCDGAERLLRDTNRQTGDFQSPRDVVLFMAGVHLCRVNHDQARVYYDHARSQYGLEQFGGDTLVCELYKSVASVLEQAPRENFSCPYGTPPPWRYGDNGRDDPLTFDVDESKRTEDLNTTGRGREETNPTPTIEATATDEPATPGP
jgi:hypothetical protein